MNFEVHIALPEAPNDNLAKQIDIGGFFANVRVPIPPETEEDIIRQDLANYLIDQGIISEDRRDELIFDLPQGG
ncbi:hypothetical protein D1822_15175 [Phaeobacter inhibens]|uniref:hypothetical protein n=1 Tax=Phaeobacter inhibens TaxID=221822 RepID=UPI0001632F95|nr:hypothetical protein [Phaeobacter inhibens]AFO92739.1 hypothetical protein PGA1_c30880 [Phaeobacter inhibens DSM 17395]AUQ47442.1 hypothetical protein PhaeoP10_03136 [Phaeobacter inhibens]AXT24045.1 hypothetical protein D1822_15175 [Phaeobacter inhibens]